MRRYSIQSRRVLTEMPSSGAARPTLTSGSIGSGGPAGSDGFRIVKTGLRRGLGEVGNGSVSGRAER